MMDIFCKILRISKKKAYAGVLKLSTVYYEVWHGGFSFISTTRVFFILGGCFVIRNSEKLLNLVYYTEINILARK